MIRKFTPPVKPVTITKRAFMQQYVLNRAATVTDSLDGVLAVKTAQDVWNAIEKECK